MIREMGNVEQIELCETIPKVQRSQCLLYWNQGIIYCLCGQFLVESESSQHFHQWRLDAPSIPHNAIRVGRPRGARHGKTEARKSISWPTMRGGDVSKKKFDGIHDHFLRDQVYRDKQHKIEEKCIARNNLAQEDHFYCPSIEEYERYRKTGLSD